MLLGTPARASEDGFAPLFTSTLNGDFVVTGSYSRVFGVPTAQGDPFTVTLGGIPAGSSIVAAFANWTYLTDAPGDPDEAAITINGSPVIGSVSAAIGDLGWGKAAAASSTADVTSLVTGNGTFTIGGAVDEITPAMPDPITKAFGEGFSLLAVFSNPASPLNHVHIYSGYTSNTSNPPEGFAPASAVYDFTIGAPLVAGPSQVVRVDLQTPGPGMLRGKAPRGVVINSAGTRAFVSNFVSRSITAVDISNPTAPALVGTSGGAPTYSGQFEQFVNSTGLITATNDLRNGAPLPSLVAFGARRDFGIATLSDDRVFIIGGRNGSGNGSLITGANPVLEFNPRTGVLRTRNSIGFTPRHSLGAGAVKTSNGPRIYAIGGYPATFSTASPVGTVEEYNPAANTWRTVATLPNGVAQFGITVAGGLNTADPRELIHVVSGNAGSEAAPVLAPATFSVQRFQADPTGPGIWSNFSVTGLTARRNHGAATALRGVAARIFVIGGQDAAGTVLGMVEEYTNATVPAAVLTPHTSLPAPRARFGIASTLSTNQIYVMGGVDNTGADQATVLEYTIAANPSSPGPAGPPGTPSGTWVTRGNLSAARRRLGVSNPPGVTNLLTARNSGRDARQDAIAVWIARNLRSAEPPVSATDPGAMAGRTLFGTTGLVIPGVSCATCHGGGKWTRSIRSYVAPPSPADNLGLGNENVIGAELRKTATQPGVFPGVLINVGTFTLGGGRVNEIRVNAADPGQAIAPLGANGFNIPSLLSAHETAPYFYSGLAQTLDDVLNGSQDGNGGVRHHFVTNPAQRAALIAFLRSIDDSTPIFP